MKIKLLFISLIFLFYSCEKEKKSIVKSEKQITKEEIDSTSINNVIIDTVYNKSAPIDEYCYALEFQKKQTVDEIKNNSKEVNNELYESYKKNRKAYIRNISQLKSSVLDEYVNFYDADKSDYVLPERIKKIEQMLKEVDVEFWYVGEGYTEFRNSPKHFYNLFKGKVTNDYEDYIKQLSKEDELLYSSDAGLTVSFEEVGKRVIFWEKFIQKYPNSKLILRAKNNFNNYLNDFIFGLDNTPTFEEGKIYPECSKAYAAFQNKYPNSITSKKIKELLDLVEANNSHEDIFSKLNLEERSWNDE